MKGLILKDNFEDVSCCKAVYDDLCDAICEFDLILKSYYWNLGVNRAQTFSFCPYCGLKLPCLIHEYFDELEKALDKEYCDITPDEIPEEFKSDEWWRKRGL